MRLGLRLVDGTGWQIHAENLAKYLAGRDGGDTDSRWGDPSLPIRS